MIAPEPTKLEAARAGYEAWARGDLEQAVAAITPDFELHEDPAFPEASVYYGPDAFVSYARSFLEMFEEWSLDVEELIEHGDQLLAFVRWRVRGKGSGAEVQMPIAHLWTFRGAHPVRMRAYLDAAEARRALG